MGNVTLIRGRKVITNVCRALLAVTFVLSGYVKAVDPLGSLYKLQDYLAAAGLGGCLPDWLLLAAAVGLASLEFVMGVFLTFSIHRRIVTRLATVFMAVMTVITVWIYLYEPVKDCGCFGDALTLSNGATLLKNIVLLACAALVARYHGDIVRLISLSNQWIVSNYAVLYVLATCIYSLYALPPFDFRPYHVGADIRKGMEMPEDAEQPQFETTFIMRKDGVTKEFTLDDYPDSTWEHVETRTIQTSKGYEPPIHDFIVTDDNTGEDITEALLARRGATLMLVSPSLKVADDSNFGDIDRAYEWACEHHVPFCCLTASADGDRAVWRDLTGAEYPFYTVDETTLKTIIRSNPGLLMLKNGVVMGKWSHNLLPDEKTLTALADAEAREKPDEGLPLRKIISVLLTFFLPLTLLTVADRLWAWSLWLRKNRKLDILFKFFKTKKNMRKKIVAGNWKMNMNLQDGIALAKEINDALVADKPNCDVVICTPFIHLASVAGVLDASVVGLGAENCADKEKGTYTGEASAEMVKSTGAQYVILGHSERREYYGETAEILKEKTDLALKHGLKVIFCCGETLEEREAEKQNEVVKAELEGSVFHLDAEAWKNIIIAYEPIWAIGTGRTATSDQAEEMLAYIRSIVAEKYGNEAAEETSILYGGSCKASNAPELFSKPNIDGGLIGGASLKCADFKGIIDAWKK